MKTITIKTTYEIKEATAKDVYCSSFSGVYLTGELTPKEITSILGIKVIKSCDYKVTKEWWFKIGDYIFTIYDYKNHKWHVGSKNISNDLALEIITQIFGKKNIK